MTFGAGWKKSHCALGEQIGDYAHVPGGHAWGPNPSALRECADAVYPLPVQSKGRYALMGRVPFVRTTPAGSSTVLEVVSGGKSVELSWNQALGAGKWHRLGVFSLEKGASLRIVPNRSRGIVAADAFALVREEGEER